MKSNLKIVLLCWILVFSFNANAINNFKIHQQIRKAFMTNDTSKRQYFLKTAKKNNAKTWEDFSMKYELYFYLKIYDSALVCISRSIEIYPSYYSGYLNKANCYRLLQQYDKAFEALNLALKLDSTSVPLTYNSRGNLYFEIGQYQNALNDYDKSIRLGHNQIDDIYLPSAKIYKSKCNYLLGNFNEAIKDLDFKENDTTYYGRYASLERGKIYYTLLKKEESDSAFNNFLKKSKNKFQTALAYAYLGDREKALCPFIKYKPSISDKDDYYNIAAIYAVLNDRNDALKYIALALENGYKKFEYLKADYDLINIKNSPEFIALIEKYQNK